MDENELRQRLDDLARNVTRLEAEIAKLSGDASAKTAGDRLKDIHQHAWSWFSYHAGQRVSMFNYFLAAAALLFAGFGAAYNADKWLLALILSLLGALASIGFAFLDLRNEELVGYGKSVLWSTEAALFHDGVHGVGILLADKQRYERKETGRVKLVVHLLSGKHKVWLPAIELFVCAVFAISAGVSLYKLWHGEEHESDAKNVAASTADLAAATNTMAPAVDTRYDFGKKSEGGAR